jgi:hypothetical protein
LWFRRDRLVIVSPAREPSRPLSGRNATYYYRVIKLAACVVAGSLAGSKDIAEGGA